MFRFNHHHQRAYYLSHAHAPYVMLLHHHNGSFTFLKIFKFSDFNKLPEDDLNNDRNMLECFYVF